MSDECSFITIYLNKYKISHFSIIIPLKSTPSHCQKFPSFLISYVPIIFKVHPVFFCHFVCAVTGLMMNLRCFDIWPIGIGTRQKQRSLEPGNSALALAWPGAGPSQPVFPTPNDHHHQHQHQHKNKFQYCTI